MKPLIELLKKIPVDLGQGAVANWTEGKQIAKRLTPNGKGKSALDLGARFGEQTRWLRQQGYRVTSVDVDPKFMGCERVDANGVLPYSNDTFDFIWCSEVIEHLEDPVFSLKELRRVTRPGGRIVLTTPNSYMWLFAMLNLFGFTPQRLQREDHIHFFDFDAVKELHEASEIFGYFPYLGPKMTIKHAWMLKWLTPTFVIKIDLPSISTESTDLDKEDTDVAQL